MLLSQSHFFIICASFFRTAFGAERQIMSLSIIVVGVVVAGETWRPIRTAIATWWCVCSQSLQKVTLLQRDICILCGMSEFFSFLCKLFTWKKKTHPACKHIRHPVHLFTRLLTDIDSGVEAGEGSPGLICDVSKKPHHCAEVTWQNWRWLIKLQGQRGGSEGISVLKTAGICLSRG